MGHYSDGYDYEEEQRRIGGLKDELKYLPQLIKELDVFATLFDRPSQLFVESRMRNYGDKRPYPPKSYEDFLEKNLKDECRNIYLRTKGLIKEAEDRMKKIQEELKDIK